MMRARVGAGERMENKVCPVCAARWTDLFNFCPIDAARLEPLAGATRTRAVVTAHPAPAPASLNQVPSDIAAGAARALADSLDALDRPDDREQATGTERRERPRPDIRGPLTTRRRKRVDQQRVREGARAEASEPGRPDPGTAAEGPKTAPAQPRDPSMFSDTEWFRRPVDPARIDPTTFKVQVAPDDYRYNDKVPTAERRRFTLRRAPRS